MLVRALRSAGVLSGSPSQYVEERCAARGPSPVFHLEQCKNQAAQVLMGRVGDEHVVEITTKHEVRKSFHRGMLRSLRNILHINMRGLEAGP